MRKYVVVVLALAGILAGYAFSVGPEQVINTICIRTESGTPESCKDSDGKPLTVWWEDQMPDGQIRVRCHPDYCELGGEQKTYNPYLTTNLLDIKWADTEPSLCCANLPDIEVILDTKIETNRGDVYAAAYRTNTIFLPPKGSMREMIDGVNPYEQWEVVAHEYTHHYVMSTNPRFNDRTDRVLRAISEALADAMVFVTDLADFHTSVSRDWKIFEDLYHNKYRDLAQPRSFESYEPQTDEHENAKIFGHFFYRLAQQKDITSKDVLRILMRFPHEVPNNTLEDFTIQQFKDIVKKISIDIKKDAVPKAVDQVVRQMDYPEGYEPGIPAAPGFITGSFAGCRGSLSYDTVTHETIPNATYYILYGAAEDSGQYNYNYQTVTTTNSVYIGGYSKATWKVAACNPHGCSPKSTATYHHINQNCY